jgi:hypothetical protein
MCGTPTAGWHQRQCLLHRLKLASLGEHRGEVLSAWSVLNAMLCVISGTSSCHHGMEVKAAPAGHHVCAFSSWHGVLNTEACPDPSIWQQRLAAKTVLRGAALKPPSASLAPQIQCGQFCPDPSIWQQRLAAKTVLRGAALKPPSAGPPKPEIQCGQSPPLGPPTFPPRCQRLPSFHRAHLYSSVCVASRLAVAPPSRAPCPTKMTKGI